MQISGELIGSSIIVQKPKEVGRLFQKSHFGTPLPGNRLQSDLIEAVFLLDEQKINIFQKKKEIHFQDLVTLAAQQLPDFETTYVVFKDLRNRGHAIKLYNGEKPITFSQIKEKNEGTPPFYIAVFSERDLLDIDAIVHMIKSIQKKNGRLWFALVDEEGDLTYYDVSKQELKGDITDHEFPRGSALLLKNRLLLFDTHLAHELFEKEFFGKPFGEGLQLSFVEALFLVERQILTVNSLDDKILSKDSCMKLMEGQQPDIQQRLVVFHDLKQRGLLVKTGFKFGAHFRAYTTHPEKTHAEYLIHVVEKGFTSIWAEISRAVRLAHSVNKEFFFARVDRTCIDYIKLGRLRP